MNIIIKMWQNRGTLTFLLKTMRRPEKVFPQNKNLLRDSKIGLR